MIESAMTLSMCLLALVVNIMVIQPVYSLEDSTMTQQISRVRKRSYSPWSVSSRNSLSLYNAGNVFKPAPYTIQRPYYIPVYGIRGGNLIFYPPQQIYVNPGVPIDNPVKPPYQAPTYLPPKETTTQMTVNRFGEDDDDAPIWGNGPMVQMPLSGDQNKEWSNAPTRPPMASNQYRPPLVHDQQQGKEFLVRPATTPRPTPERSTGPSNCVWAIVSCCSVGNPTDLHHNCFEQRGCPGPFWGDSPCNSDFAKAAIETAMKYYSSNPGAAMGK